MIYFSPPYMDRAHRIGQERPVTVYRLLTEWSVEERLYHRCLRRRGKGSKFSGKMAVREDGLEDQMSISLQLVSAKYTRS